MKTSKQIGQDLYFVQMDVEGLQRDLSNRAPDTLSVEAARIVAERLDRIESMVNAAKVDIVEHKRAGLRARAEDATEPTGL